MKYGDISNDHAPTILIDARLIMGLKPPEGFLNKVFKKPKLQVFDYASELLYSIHRNGVEIWVVTPDVEGFRYPEVYEIIDNNSLYVNSVIQVSAMTLEMYLRLEYIHGFFYPGEAPKTLFSSIDKYYEVKHLLDVINHF